MKAIVPFFLTIGTAGLIMIVAGEVLRWTGW
jgi:hypothetical protein